MSYFHKIYTLTVLFFFAVILLNAQNTEQHNSIGDSLKLELKKAKHDTTRCEILSAMIEDELNDQVWSIYNEQLQTLAEANLKAEIKNDYLRNVYLKYLADALNNKGVLYVNKGAFSKALEYYTKSLSIQNEIQNKEGVANALINIGQTYLQQGLVPEALEILTKALQKQEEIGNKNGIAVTEYNLAGIYYEKGDITKALQAYKKSLKLEEELSNDAGIAASLQGLASIYYVQGDVAKSIEYYERVLKISEKANTKRAIASALSNLATSFSTQGNTVKALEYFNRSLKIDKELENKLGVAMTLNSMGTVYYNQKNLDKALECFSQAFNIHREIGNKKGVTISLYHLSNVYYQQKKHAKALEMSLASLKLSQELGYPEHILLAAQRSKDIYKLLNKPAQALNMYELYITMRDSINNIKTQKASIQMQVQLAYDKKAVADSIKSANEKKVAQIKLTLRENQIKQEKQHRIALYVGLLFVLVVAIFMFNRFKITQQQKRIIEDQKKNIELHLQQVEQLKHNLELDLNHYMQAELRKLMNPHFIFNSLNSIQSFILENDQLAASLYLSKFSNLMRNVLDNSRQKVIPIKKEMETLAIYIELEQQRFDNKFKYLVEVDSEIDLDSYYIPPLILQPIAENAIWHGMMHKEGEGLLKISFKKNKDYITIMVEDDGIGREKAAKLNTGKLNHVSAGINITDKRIQLLNSVDNTNINIKYIDKKDDSNKSLGTIVEINIPVLT